MMKKFIYLLLLGVFSFTTNQPAIAQKKSASQTKKPVKQEATVYVTRTGSKYHAEYCRYLRSSSIPMKKSEAVSGGYTACSRCSP